VENTLKASKPKPDPFSKNEVYKIVENIHPFYKNLATVLFFSGMRFSEMAGLKWSNVDFNKKVIHIEEVLVEEELGLPKTEYSQREILMLPMVIEALRDQRKATWGRGNGFVFLNMHKRNMKPTSFNQKIWKKACSKAEIRYRPVKNTRSTYISLMLDAGVDMGWVAEQVGHSSFKMIYEHYYKYLNTTDPSAKFLEYIAPEKKEALEKDHKMVTSIRAKKK
jgi:integrase